MCAPFEAPSPVPVTTGMPRTGEGQSTAPLVLLSVLGMLVAAAGLGLRRGIKMKVG